MAKIKAYYIDTINNAADVIDIEPSLETYYDLLNCRCVDITSRRFERGKRYFDIICDDEGLLGDNPIVSAVDAQGMPMLVGNLLICRHDDEGNETSLTDADVRLIERHIGYFYLRNRPRAEAQVVLFSVAY